MSPEPALANALCLDGDSLRVDGDFAVVYTGRRAVGALAVWNLADGTRRAAYTQRGGTYAVGGGRLFDVSTVGDTGAVSITARSLRTGRVVSRCTVEANDEYFPTGLWWRDDLLYLSAGSTLEVLAVEEGARQAATRLDADWASVAGFTPRCVLVREEDGPLRALARRTLEPRWSLDERAQWSVAVDDARVAVCAAGTTEPTDATLRCLDADTGRALWTVERPLRPLALTGGLVLAADAHGWLVALDRDTGATRWRQWLDARALVVAATADGFAALTAEALVELGRDGAAIARRRRETFDGTTTVAFAAGRIVCNTSLAATVERRPRAAVATTEPLRAPPRRAIEWADGASLFRPACDDLEAVRAVVASCDDLDECWERLVAQGITSERAPHGERVFVAERDASRVGDRPWTRGAMLRVAASWRSVVQAEALWREAAARAAQWSAREATRAPRWSVMGGAEPTGVDGEEPWRAAMRAALGAVPDEVTADIEQQAAHELGDARWSAPWIARALLGDALWRTADEHGLRVREGVHRDERFSSMGNPFAPLCDLVALGFAWNPSGDLVLTRFADDLQSLLVPWEDEIPF